MTRRTITAALGALVVGSLVTVGCAPVRHVSQSPSDTVSSSQSANAVQPLDCRGTTGWHGCGPGWFWRDGWRGLGCYPC